MKFSKRSNRPTGDSTQTLAKTRRSSRNGRMSVENLEHRCLLSTYTVSEFKLPLTSIWGVSVQVDNGPATVTYRPSSPFTVSTASGSNTVDILNTSANIAIDIAGLGNDVVNVGTGGSVQGIVGAVSVETSPNSTTLNVNDGSDTAAKTATLSTFTPTGDTAWGSITGLSPGAINYRYADTGGVHVNDGTGSNTVGILATGVPTYLASSGGAVAVNVGNAGYLSSINSPIYVQTAANSATLSVNDGSDILPRSITLSTYTPVGDTAWGSITGIAPAAINYRYAGTSQANITTGGFGGATVNVLATGVPTYVGGGYWYADIPDVINVGNAGSVQGINGPLYVETALYDTTINVDDVTYSALSTVALTSYTPAGDTAWGSIIGLAPANISYRYTDVTRVNLTAGSAAKTVDVLGTGSPTYLSSSGYAIVNVGNVGTVQGIDAALYIENPSWSTTLNVNDGSDDLVTSTTLSRFTAAGGAVWGSVTGLAPAAIDYLYGDVSSLNLDTGHGNDTINILATPVATYLNSGGGSDIVNVGNAGTLQGIVSPLYITNPPAFTKVNINDGNDATAGTVVLSTYTPTGDSAWGSISGLAPARINYRYYDTQSVNITTGTARETLDVLATGTPTYLSSNGGMDSVVVGNANSAQGINGALYVQNASANGGLFIGDGADSVSRTVTLNTFTGADGTAWGSVTGLAPASINYRYAGTSGLELVTGTAVSTDNILATGVATNLEGDANDIVNIGNGNVQSIEGALTIDDYTSGTVININDSSDAAVRTASLSTNLVAGFIPWASITGLAPGKIAFEWDQVQSVNTQAPWELTWNVNPNAVEAQVGFIPVTDDGYVINAAPNANWSGYVAETSFSSPQANSVTAVSGSWTVPSVSGSSTVNTNSSIWVGIDGQSNSTVEQIGTEEDYLNGSPFYQAWWEMYSSNGTTANGQRTEFPIPRSQMPINARDSITASVQYISTGTHAGQFFLSIDDTTQNKSFSTYETSSQTQNPTAQRNSAEWIVEDPAHLVNGVAVEDTLADFNYVTFTNATATINGVTGPINDSSWQAEAKYITVSGTTNKDLTTSLSGSGESFQVDYNNLGLLFPQAMSLLPQGTSKGVMSTSSSASSVIGSQTVAGLEDAAPSDEIDRAADVSAPSVYDEALAELIALNEATPPRTMVLQSNGMFGTTLSRARFASPI